MKIDFVKEELTMNLETLVEQFEMINAHNHSIPQIELDIFMKNIQKLYENAIFLKRANSSVEKEVIAKVVELEAPKAIVEIEVEAIAETEPIIIEEKIEMLAELPEEVKETIIETPQAKIEEVIEAPKEEPNMVNTEMESLRFESKYDDLLEDSAKELDLFSGVKPSQEITDLNKKLAEARNTHSIVEKLQNQRIESLKSVIGINDKFYFINELFGGDAKKYEDVIYTLNNFKRMEEAIQYFGTLKYRFSWEDDSQAYEKLSHMIERKFNLINA